MSAQLIFSDLDGTLINDDLKVTAATRDAIRRQIINGNIFVPASARLPKGMMTVVNQILKVCPFIAYNGALALDETGKVLISRFFNAKEAAEICRYVMSKIMMQLGISIVAMFGIVVKKRAHGLKMKKELSM